MQIRPAIRDDAPLILDLIRELAVYERAPDAVNATVEALVRDGFGDKPVFHVLIAEDAEGPAGFALYFFTYSTWEGRSCLYLEDLFVRPSFRGRGIGLALMRTLAAEAVTRGCPRFQWQVLDWNQPAIDFYQRFGADVQREWQTVRLEGDALVRASQF
ncbi:MAG: Histone acetyltransferase [Myxococcaceae bacterium]|jgi:GNAT superfamily N-acetyltransferase|nr:Histone acetyltransferase [Myxococcaceae bacterium]